VVAWNSGSALVLINVVTLTSGPFNTWMGDRLWVNQPPIGQLSLSSFRFR